MSIVKITIEIYFKLVCATLQIKLRYVSLLSLKDVNSKSHFCWRTSIIIKQFRLDSYYINRLTYTYIKITSKWFLRFVIQNSFSKLYLHDYRYI